MKQQDVIFANHLAIYYRMCPTCKKKMKNEPIALRQLLKEYCEFCLCSVPNISI